MNLQTALTTAAATATIACQGGRNMLYAAGDFGGGTLTLTWSPTEAGTFVPIETGVSLTASGSKGFEVADGFIKATLSGSVDASVVWGIASTGKRP